MHIMKEVCYMITSFSAIPFFYDRVVNSSDSYVFYFATCTAAIHYNKGSVVDSRKFEGYVYLRKTIVALRICNH